MNDHPVDGLLGQGGSHAAQAIPKFAYLEVELLHRSSFLPVADSRSGLCHRVDRFAECGVQRVSGGIAEAMR
jgi:hypothetical protein